MISYFQALILGLIQGLTEFLPISSSGHLVVGQQLFGISLEAQQLAAFDVALHAGTLIAVLCYYAKDLIAVVTTKDWATIKWVAIGTVPAMVIGLLWKDVITGLFSSVLVVGIAWCVTGAILWGSQYARDRQQPWNARRSFIVGCAQAFAMLPGISRSGSTIVAAMGFGISPLEAARYSFYLAIPVIGGSVLLEARHVTALGPDIIGPTLLGITVSAVSGYLAILWMLRILAKGQFKWFGLYCGGIGVITIIGQLLVAGN